MTCSLEVGSLVYVRYRDHVLFKDSDASQYQPWIRECVGWLDYENEDCIRVVWERFSEPNPPENARLRSSGLAILKKAIIEIRRIVQALSCLSDDKSVVFFCEDKKIPDIQLEPLPRLYWNSNLGFGGDLGSS